MRLRKNDTVVVLTGKDKGKRGRIFRIHPARETAYVDGINIAKRHMRPKPSVRQAGIIEREAPIHMSNLRLVCTSCNKPTKPIIRKGSDDEGITRTCKLCQAAIE